MAARNRVAFQQWRASRLVLVAMTAVRVTESARTNHAV